MSAPATAASPKSSSSRAGRSSARFRSRGRTTLLGMSARQEPIR
jgi:hypothetical protein